MQTQFEDTRHIQMASRASHDVGGGLVRSEILRGFFSLCGDRPEAELAALMREVGFDLASLRAGEKLISYRKVIHLFELSATRFECPDLGLRMAELGGPGCSLLGPLETAMRHSPTLGKAYEYCSRHIHIYSPAVHVSVESDESNRKQFLHFDIALSGVSNLRQVVEHALALTYKTSRTLSAERACLSEIWFTHGAQMPIANYRRTFNVPVRFHMPYNALYFSATDLNQPIADRNSAVYEAARSFIDERYPDPANLLVKQVRSMLVRLVPIGIVSQQVVTEALSLHPRTFQRKLSDAGTTFEALLDSVRREIALRSLADDQLSLGQITERLSYSESSVLTRSCRRWFSCAPTEWRKVYKSMIATAQSIEMSNAARGLSIN